MPMQHSSPTIEGKLIGTDWESRKLYVLCVLCIKSTHMQAGKTEDNVLRFPMIFNVFVSLSLIEEEEE